MKTRQKISLNVYLVICKEKSVLLSLRQNTGYEDGKWSLVAGHCEAGESSKAALCREALEEIGIVIKQRDLNIAHVMHRQTDRDNMDVFMMCESWQGAIKNCEPNKCGGLTFFELDMLPITPYPTLRRHLMLFLLRNNFIAKWDGGLSQLCSMQ
jgi:8-oxo-dGTP pyrophosphatase MutT (NUDIX family)